MQPLNICIYALLQKVCHQCIKTDGVLTNNKLTMVNENDGSKKKNGNNSYSMPVNTVQLCVSSVCS